MEPAVDHLIGGADTRYTMVIVAAKRARQLMAGARKRIEEGSDRPVSAALEEMAAGLVQFERLKTILK